MCSNAGKIVSIENGPNMASPPSRKARRRSGMVGGVWADGMGDGRGKLTAFVGAVSAAPAGAATRGRPSYAACRSEEHTPELQPLMRTSYAVFCLKKQNHHHHQNTIQTS